MSNKTITTKDYCNCLAQERGLAPQGTAGSFKDAVVIETNLPWQRDILQAAGPIPQEGIDLLKIWRSHYEKTGEYEHRPLVIAPDPVYSRTGHRRVLFYTRPDGPFAQYEKHEYLVPNDSVGALVWAWYQEQDNLPDFDAYCVPNMDASRDILVCTHGTIDAACAKFGYPLYKHLRDNHASDTLRVWRVSHFGGHVFAPTLIDMPTGHYWAYLNNNTAAQVIRREVDVKTLSGYYRGWAGVEYGFQQTAEHALWQQEGWSWFDTPKVGETITKDDGSADPQWAEVRLRWKVPGVAEITNTMRVEVSHRVVTPPATERDKTYPYPQYTVVKGQTS